MQPVYACLIIVIVLICTVIVLNSTKKKKENEDDFKQNGCMLKLYVHVAPNGKVNDQVNVTYYALARNEIPIGTLD